MRVADAVLALDGGDELVDERVQLPGVRARLPIQVLQQLLVRRIELHAGRGGRGAPERPDRSGRGAGAAGRSTAGARVQGRRRGCGRRVQGRQVDGGARLTAGVRRRRCVHGRRRCVRECCVREEARRGRLAFFFTR